MNKPRIVEHSRRDVRVMCDDKQLVRYTESAGGREPRERAESYMRGYLKPGGRS